MILSFFNEGTEDIFNRKNSQAARTICPVSLWRVAQRKLDQLNAAVSLRSLAIPPGNRLEALDRERRGEHSIRITTRNTGSASDGRKKEPIVSRFLTTTEAQPVPLEEVK